MTPAVPLAAAVVHLVAIVAEAIGDTRKDRVARHLGVTDRTLRRARSVPQLARWVSRHIAAGGDVALVVSPSGVWVGKSGRVRIEE